MLTEKNIETQSEDQHLQNPELNNVDEYGNEIELELHDYVNLQECHEMMNELHSSCFDPNLTASNIHPFSQKDNDKDNSQHGASAFYQNGVYCFNCKTGYVDFKEIYLVEIKQYKIIYL